MAITRVTNAQIIQIPTQQAASSPASMACVSTGSTMGRMIAAWDSHFGWSMKS